MSEVSSALVQDACGGDEQDTSQSVAVNGSPPSLDSDSAPPQGIKSLSPMPTLRVEELREDDGHSSSASYVSEEEGALSHGESSDHEREEFHPPDDELKDRIIKQVEFYFSDANILKDAFLLKHVRRNKLGFVSLKLITSFRKVKSLTKDYRVVAYSLRLSDQLEVNEEGTKVRRITALPDYDETTPSRTVVAVNLPYESPTIENVAELFGKCGDISLIRVLRPGKVIPPDVKKHINKHPELGNTVCAVIEFEQHEAAKKSCDTMTNADDWRKGMRVVLLAVPKPKNKEKSHDQKKGAEKGKQEVSKKDSEMRNEGNEAEEGRNKKRRNKKKQGLRVDEVAQRDAACSSGSDGDGETRRADANQRRSSAPAGPQHSTVRSSLSPKQDSNRLSPSDSPRVTPRNSPRNSPRSSPRSSPTARRKNIHGKSPLATDTLSPGASPRPSPCVSPESRRRSGSGDLGSSPGHSPWVQRRLKAQASPLAGSSPGASPRLGRRLADGSMPDGPGRLADMEGVIRQPNGPDGSPGFYGGMGRGIPPRAECSP